MKKGRLIKDKTTWKIDAKGMKKPMPVSKNFDLTDDMEGKEIEFDNSGGPVKCIRFEEKDYTKINMPPKSDRGDRNRGKDYPKEYDDRKRHQNNGNNKREDPARAPYNFVPLNKEVVPSDGKVDHSSFSGLCGYINLTLETKQPLFIRGGDKLFFNNKGQSIIPGSSVRGMIANLVNIVSYGKLSQFDGKKLYKRSGRNTDGDNVSAGFLYRDNGTFKIRKAHAEQLTERGKNAQPFSYDFNNNSCVFSTGKFGNRMIVWKVKLNRSEEQKEHIIDRKTIESYQSDKNRADTAIDLLQSLNKGKIADKSGKAIGNCTISNELGIPVFYRTNERGEVVSFGHAKYYRMPYKKSIKNHIQQDSIPEADFNETLFGNVEKSSKVFFEDLIGVGEIKFDLKEPKPHKILSSPKPTCYPHYLKQPGIYTSQADQKKWSDDAAIRGFKQYWHRETSSDKNHKNSWIADKSDKNNPDPIKPVSPGNTFSGRIRFDNLTEAELGALLFVLGLPEGCFHKLGLGKPLGLGSVQITPELTLINRQKRYETLFDISGSWNLAEDSTANIEKHKNCFAKYMGQQLSNSSIVDAPSYWSNDERMKALKEMLTYRHKIEHSPVSWIDRTRYMELAEFKNRPVLPTPKDVIQYNMYKKK